MAKSSLLTPDDHALLLIDHQYLQLLALRSHTSEAVVNNTTFLAKAAKLFKVPTLLDDSFCRAPGTVRGGPGRLPGPEADRPDRAQFLGRSAGPRLGQEDRQEEAGDGRPVD